MNVRDMIIGISLITAIGLGWQLFLIHEYRVHPEWKRPGEDQQQVASNTPPSISPAPGASSEPSFVAATQSTGPWHMLAATQPAPAPQTLIGSTKFDDSHYHMGVTVNEAGAGVESVVLNQYRQEVDSAELFTFQTPYDQDPAGTRALGTTAVVIDGVVVPTAGANWELESGSDHSVTYGANFQGPDGKSVVHVEKQYVIDPAGEDAGTSQGYEVLVNYVIANQGSDSHIVSLRFNGPNDPKAETARQETDIVAGYDDDNYVKTVNQPLSQFSSSHPSKDFTKSDDNLKMLWIGAASNYFDALVRPVDGGKLANTSAAAINPDSVATDRVVSVHFTSIDFKLNAGSSAQLPLRVFFGPKRRALLGSRYYSSFPLQYDSTLVLVNGLWICALCTWPWLISFLVGVLAVLHFVLRDWGLAIIVLVCGVRALLHPITKRSQVSMMKMQKLAPEVERLKKKFGDDKEGFQKAQMELYKTVGFTPILGCLPMFIQMPIFIALWRALQTTFELRQAPFLYFFGIHFSWIHDLSQPDGLVKFASPIPLIFGMSISAINILPLAMAVVTFINQKYFTPKPAAASPEQEQQQKMMMWMTLVFPFMFYTFPSGLNLYYLTSTTLGIIESKIVRNHIKRADEAQGGSGPVIIDVPRATRSARRRQDEQPQEPKKKSWLTRKIEEFQAKADEISRKAEQQKKKNRR